MRDPAITPSTLQNFHNFTVVEPWTLVFAFRNYLGAVGMKQGNDVPVLYLLGLDRLARDDALRGETEKRWD